MKLIGIFKGIRRRDRDHANVEIIEGHDGQMSLTAAQFRTMSEELIRNFRSLDATISRLEGENAELRTENSQLRVKMVAKELKQPYTPSKSARDILIKFCGRDTTVMSESDLLASSPECPFEVKRALSELCQHDLLTTAMMGSATSKSYIVTARAQELVLGRIT
jgi:hypothetical protein